MCTNSLNNFKSHLRRRLCDESTIASYASDAQGYIEFIGGQLVFSSALMLDFIYHMSQRGLSPATIQRRAIGVIQLWRYAYDQGITAQRPVTLAEMGVKLRRGNFRTIPLSPADFDQLLTELTHALNEIN